MVEVNSYQLKHKSINNQLINVSDIKFNFLSKILNLNIVNEKNMIKEKILTKNEQIFK